MRTRSLDGTGLDIPEHQWGLFTLQNLSYVIVEGFEVRNYTTNSTRDVPIGIFVVGAGSNDQLVNNFVHDITTTAATNPRKCGSNAFGITVYGTEVPDGDRRTCGQRQRGFAPPHRLQRDIVTRRQCHELGSCEQPRS